MTTDLQSLFLHREAESRSISAENPDGAKGGGGQATNESTLHARSAYHGRELGSGWKQSPCRAIAHQETVSIMEQKGPGIIRHIWVTLDPAFYRDIVMRVYWDDQDTPSIECPIGDFFCSAWGVAHPVQAIPINVNPKGGLNCFLPMPFRKNARVDICNEGPNDLDHFFYTIDYSLEDVPAEALFLHSQFRRTHRQKVGEAYTILDGVSGAGHYIGTFLAWEQRSKGWWGEGEIKMYLDGDQAFPTICGTGTEDYFGGAWCFGENYSAPFMGYRLTEGDEGIAGARMTMYRFHIPDPIYFKEEIRATVQALGWQSNERYLQLQDDIASVAFWYQTLPHMIFPPLPNQEERTIVCTATE